jgi:hypothetical protein
MAVSLTENGYNKFWLIILKKLGSLKHIFCFWRHFHVLIFKSLLWWFLFQQLLCVWFKNLKIVFGGPEAILFLYSSLLPVRGQPTMKYQPFLGQAMHFRLLRLPDLNWGLTVKSLVSLPMSHHFSLWATTTPYEHHYFLWAHHYSLWANMTPYKSWA